MSMTPFVYYLSVVVDAFIPNLSENRPPKAPCDRGAGRKIESRSTSEETERFRVSDPFALQV